MACCQSGKFLLLQLIQFVQKDIQRFVAVVEVYFGIRIAEEEAGGVGGVAVNAGEV